MLRSVGLGLITGAADDDCAAVGTYAQAGAQFGYNILWMAPLALPMMIAVVYLSGKLGLVTGEGLFSVLRRRSPRWLLFLVLVGVIIGNIIEAGADIGGMAAALGLLVPLPRWAILVGVTSSALAFQIWGSYTFIRNVLRVLAMSLLAYVASALMAKPNWGAVLRGTLMPHLHFDRAMLTMIVAIIGASLSAYIFTWQSNEEVEEKIAAGHRTVRQRRGATPAQLRQSLWDVIFGMLFSNAVMYFIMLATAATLFVSGHHGIESAADVAIALRPAAGRFASGLFAIGIIGVGMLAVPVMTTGAAYDVCQAAGARTGLSLKPNEAKLFYFAITVFTVAAMVLNFLGINPMHALVFAGIVQGFSTPPLMVLIMVMTNQRKIMGDRVNRRLINILGWGTTAVIWAASLGLIISYLVH
ncbi:Nramp family divalent metal transporter [Occallatibacter savannae]|uniref:Nramp family divalent metal transporter n=1 Tax=Occallatibacter savannae TaxID=1002691 RepID=UPI000D68A240|nr:Nramp family divalent metal transporter [Occallatibacter savannae]